MRTLALLIVVAGCGGAHPAAAPPSVNTGDPLPAAAPQTAECTGGYRWLDSDPHVPLTIADADGMHDASDCCAAWAHEGDVWTAVDAWGAPSGDRTISGGEGYDVTQCYELTTDEDSRGLLVRGDQPWRAPTSAAWEPSDAERAALLQLAAAVDQVFEPAGVVGPDDAVEPPSPLAQRVVFFQMAPFEGDDRAPIHWAAISGRALAIAGEDADGTWALHYLDGSWSFGNPWVGDAYRIIGVFDLDGDHYPEVIVHRNEGVSWDDEIITCDHDSTMRVWREGAESVGGSTA